MSTDPELLEIGLTLAAASAAGGCFLYAFAENLQTYGDVREDLKKHHYSVADIREKYKDRMSSPGRELAILFSRNLNKNY